MQNTYITLILTKITSMIIGSDSDGDVGGMMASAAASSRTNSAMIQRGIAAEIMTRMLACEQLLIFCKLHGLILPDCDESISGV